jgi:23S rRNA (uridine2552-2'-O)-methyltransferase
VLLSDAAPKLTGIRDTDRANEERLLEAIERLLPELLRPGGGLLIKILEGPKAQAIDKRMLRASSRRRRSRRRPPARAVRSAICWPGASPGEL